MNILNQTRDFAMYAQLLRGNFQKGAAHLRSILAVPDTAEDFIANVGGLMAVYGGTYKDSNDLNNPNNNELLLVKVLSQSIYHEQAIINWLNIAKITTKTTIAEIIADEETLIKILNNRSLMLAVTAPNSTVSTAILNEMAKYPSIINSILDSAYLMNYMFILRLSPDSSAKLMYLLVQTNFDKTYGDTTIRAEYIVQNLPLIKLIADDATLMNQIVRVRDYMVSLVNTSPVFNIVANSENAMYYMVRRRESKQEMLNYMAVTLLSQNLTSTVRAAWESVAENTQTNSSSTTTAQNFPISEQVYILSAWSASSPVRWTLAQIYYAVNPTSQMTTDIIQDSFTSQASARSINKWGYAITGQRSTSIASVLYARVVKISTNVI